jgi:hypothetical protein
MQYRAGLHGPSAAAKTPPPARRDTESREDGPRMGGSAKWTGRDPSPDVLTCAVAGCGAPATSTLRSDPSLPRAWLVDLAPGAGEHLCTRHADALEATGDWVLHDERRRHRGRAPAADDLQFDDDEDHDRLDLRRPDPRPVADLLDARSPLLSRAFAKSRDEPVD